MIARLASRRNALILVVLEAVLLALILPIRAESHRSVSLLGVFFIGAFVVVGGVVAFRRPRLRMGWMLLAAAGFLLLALVGSSYSILHYTEHRGTPALGAAAVMVEPSWASALALLVLCILLYPEGRMPSRRWRWPLRTLIGAALVWQVGAWVIAATTLLTSRVRLDSGGDLQQINNPTGVWAWWGLVQVIFFLSVAVLLLAWAVDQVRGYRYLRGERRAQQKWLLAGASVAIASMLLVTPSAVDAHPGSVVATLGNVAWAGLVALPVAIGNGVLKYRLYEIDRLVSRTVSYALLTLLLAGTFVGLVALTTDLLPFSSSVGVAASTLAAAALFNPLRIRVQRAVDRRFNRARYDAEATVDAFAAQLRDAVDLDTVQAELLAAVRHSVEPVHASVWLRGQAR